MKTALNYLGNEVKDTTTGFKGIVLAENHKFSGENQLNIQGKELKDGAPSEAVWLCSERVKLINNKKLTLRTMAHDVVIGEN